MGITKTPVSYKLEPTISQTDLIKLIDELNNDNSIDGIVLQHPIPKYLNEREVFDRISVAKDVDGVASKSFGEMAMGLDAYLSCTPAAIIELLKFYNIELQSKHVVVVGRSPILGKPLSAALINENATVITCHSYTKNIEEVFKQGDIVIAAVGQPKLVKGSWLKKGSVVIDAGYNPGNIGDVDYDDCFNNFSAITSVPGGVGPVTIAEGRLVGNIK